MHLDDKMKDVTDAAAVVSGLAVFLQFIPAVVGIVTIAYTLFRFAEALDGRKRHNQWPFAKFGSPPIDGGGASGALARKAEEGIDG